jgi:glycosyl-4,4'-diaponeurosporenoate acyltransferase
VFESAADRRGVIVRFSAWVTATLNIALWFVWSAGIGYLAHRVPVRFFGLDTAITRLRAFECGGHWYERNLRIKRWKDRLPEAGALFTGGFSKRAVRRSDLERFVIETRRAECVHWIAMSLWPVFGVWNPPWAMAVIIVYALAANVPCLVVQRYNRARLIRVLRR